VQSLQKKAEIFFVIGNALTFFKTRSEPLLKKGLLLKLQG
jgi:hypothetical protein